MAHSLKVQPFGERNSDKLSRKNKGSLSKVTSFKVKRIEMRNEMMVKMLRNVRLGFDFPQLKIISTLSLVISKLVPHLLANSRKIAILLLHQHFW